MENDPSAESVGSGGDAPGPAGPGALADGRVLLILAVDQRNSFERDLYGLKGPISSADAARISAAKLLVYEALLEALPEVPFGVRPGILVDEQYGASVAELASRSEGAVSLAMPIEKSGEDWFEFAYGDDWIAHAEFFAADQAKVLVRDNPGFDPIRRERQAALLAQVSRWASSYNRPMIIELLVPASDADKAAVEGDSVRYDHERRPGHAVAAMEFLQDHGVEPAIWKLEGLYHRQDAEKVVETARRNGRNAGCILLGRHAPHDRLDQWIALIASMPGWVGFAIGRSIWWDALQAHGRHQSTEVETRRRIREGFLDFAHFYMDARAGKTTERGGA
jgi:myo-inositol catabolism protein IolC